MQEATISSNVLVLILFSIFNTILSLKIPSAFLDQRRRLFRVRQWEDAGAVYQRMFKVKRWKNIMPELSDFFKKLFPKKRIASYDKAYLQKYLVESCRAELTHWGIIFSSFLFVFWNNFIKTAVMIVIAFVLNLPYIIIQRYNRPRIRSLLACSREKPAEEPGVSRFKPGSILIISADNTGSGHKSISQTLQQQISKLDPGVQISVVDGFSLGKRMLNMTSKLYNPLVVNMPALWGLIYRLGDHFVWLVRAFVSRHIRDKLLECLEDVRPDVIVSVHAVFIGSVLNILEKEKMDIPVIPFIADLDNVSGLWADKRSKCTLCPSVESKQTMLSLGIPEDKLRLVGFPVREEFSRYSPEPPDEGRVVPDEEASILLINGSQGSQRILEMSKVLLEHSNARISIIAGNNSSLKKCLERKLSQYTGARVRVYGFTKDIKTHMLAADILIIRASPNVLMETVNLCKPIIVVGALKGQEEKNPQFVARHNLGIVCTNVKKLPGMVSELLSQNGDKLKEIRDSQIRFRNPLAAREIAEFILGSDGKSAEFHNSSSGDEGMYTRPEKCPHPLS